MASPRSDDRGHGDSGGTEALTSPFSPWSSPATRCRVPAVYDSYLPIIRQPVASRAWCASNHRTAVDEERCRAFSTTRPRPFSSTIAQPGRVVYPREDLELLARFCQKFDTIAICDEVWEHVF